jgi:hypothetical protein
MQLQRTYEFSITVHTGKCRISTEVTVSASPFEIGTDDFIGKCHYLAVKQLKDSGYDIDNLNAHDSDYTLLPI